MNPLLYIRKSLFELTQVEFAALVGTSQATVSKWEAGELEPDRAHMDRIRRAAARRRLDWDDRLFFEVPKAGAAA